MSGRTGLQLRKQFGRIHRVDGVPPGRRVEARRHLGSRFWQRWPDYRFRFCCFSAYFRLPPHPEPLSSACSKLRKQLSRASASRLVVLGSMYFRAEKSNGLFASIAAVAFVSQVPTYLQLEGCLASCQGDGSLPMSLAIQNKSMSCVKERRQLRHSFDAVAALLQFIIS